MVENTATMPVSVTVTLEGRSPIGRSFAIPSVNLSTNGSNDSVGRG